MVTNDMWPLAVLRVVVVVCMRARWEKVVTDEAVVMGREGMRSMSPRKFGVFHSYSSSFFASSPAAEATHFSSMAKAFWQP